MSLIQGTGGGLGGAGAPGGSLAGGGILGSHAIENSVRMSDASNSQIYWEAGTPSSGNIWTASFWFKKWSVGAGQAANEMFGAGSGGAAYMFWSWDSSDKFTFQSTADGNKGNTTGSPIFRDVSAWSHMVIRADTTQSTQADRLRVYHNGEQITTWGTDSIGTSAWDYINASGFNQYWGGASGIANGNPGCNFYLADINFCDGQSYAPTEFGETVNGIWVPIDPSVTYGNNGYRLEFKQTGTSADASGIGADTSGNDNHFTVAGVTAHDVVSDSPTNNFANWNVLQPTGAASGVMTLSEGNMKATGGSSIYRQVMGNMSVLSGKWYIELYITDAGYPSWTFGWTKATRYEAYTGSGTQSTHHASIGYFTGSNLYMTDFGSASVATRTLSYSSNGSPTTGSIIGCAADFDNGKLWWSVNGTWVDIGSGAGDPTNDTNPASTFTVSTYADDFKTPHFLNYNGSAVLNTGQDSTFAGNTTAGGNADDNGVGDFKYAPPSGFLALCTSNLPEPTIGPNSTEQADDYFNTVLYTGNGSTQSITGAGFQPDWVWLKARGYASGHALFDSVRGATEYLASETTTAESTLSDTLTSFDSDGFSLGANNGTNRNSTTFVSWNWKAGGATPSQTYTVKVVSDSGNKYRFDDFGTSAVTLELQEGGTYTFDQSDSSNSGHPIRFSTTSDGTHGGGSEYTTGVTTTGSPGSAGAKTVINVAASAPTLYYYCSAHSGMGGQANTTETHGSSNFKGSIQSVVSAATDARFSIATWTGTGSAGATVGHGLGAVPDVMIVKKRAGGTAYGWAVWHKDANDSSTDFLRLDTNAAQSDEDAWSDTDPTSTVLNLGANNHTNYPSGATYVGYFFKGIEGYSKFGKYVGNGNANGTFVYTGFRPAWVMVKRTNSTGSWVIFDSERSAYNLMSDYLLADTSGAEVGSSGTADIDFLSNGFKLRSNPNGFNGSGDNIIYLAFAEAPFKYANAR